MLDLGRLFQYVCHGEGREVVKLVSHSSQQLSNGSIFNLELQTWLHKFYSDPIREC